MIQKTNQRNQMGRLVGGWRIDTLFGYVVNGNRAWVATMEKPSKRSPYAVGEVHVVTVKQKGCSVVNPYHIVPQNMLGAWRSWRAMLNRCGYLGNKPCNGSYVPKGTEVFGPWTPQEYGSFSNDCLMEALEAFVDDLGDRRDGEQIHRDTDDGDYMPGECYFCNPKLHLRIHAERRARAAFGPHVNVVDTGIFSG